ncbi:MAG: RsmB/NOP family class I SAM-dependent RNA methyltransferase, partial [Opitutaceae bacterium]
WWDACAGEGGKTLHLADLMQNRGLIWASDRSVRRLQILKKRAARAQVFNYRAVAWNGGPQPPTKTRFDGILVDAPCSGVGTWQRHPHARWTVSPADVRELAAVQQKLLQHAAGSLKSGGRLVYAVCTLTRTETTGVAAAFTADHPEFEPVAVFPETKDQRSEVSGQAARPALTSDLCRLSSVVLWPQELNANGMFIAAWSRR